MRRREREAIAHLRKCILEEIDYFVRRPYVSDAEPGSGSTVVLVRRLFAMMALW